MTDLWTAAQVAQHLGVSESRARHILADNGIKRVYGYPADAVQAIQRPGQGARTDLKGSTMPAAPGVRLFDDVEEAAMARAHSPEGRAAVRQKRAEDFNQALIEWRTTTDPAAVKLAEERMVFLSVELRELLKPYVELVAQEREAHAAKVSGMDFMDVVAEIPPFQPSQEALDARGPFDAKLAELTEQFGF